MNKSLVRSAMLLGLTTAALLPLAAAPSYAASKRIKTEGVTAECTGQKTKKHSGKVQSVSLLRHTVTVMNMDTFNTTKRIFEVAGNCNISTKDNKQASLADLRLGDEIEIKYFSQKDGSDIACSITQTTKKTSKDSQSK